MKRGFLKNPFIRSALRQVRETLPRFLSILLITALGVMFFSGLRLTAPYMRASAERWFDESNLMDIQLYSTVGFHEDDISAISAQPEITHMSPGFNADVLAIENDSEISVQFLSLDYDDDSEDGPLNKPELLSGRMPVNSDECLVEEEWLYQTGTELGSTVSILSGTADLVTDTLVTDAFTVVGTAKSPLFIAEDRGNSEIGSGYNSYFFFVPPSAFSLEVYTTVYLQVDLSAIADLHLSNVISSAEGESNSGGRLSISRFSEDYFAYIAPVVATLEELGKVQSAARYEKIMSEGNKEIEDARVKVADGRKELDDAKTELENARIEIEDGRAELATSRTELDDGRAQLSASRTQLDDGWAQLSASRTQLDDGWTQYYQQHAAIQYAYGNGFITLAEYTAGMEALEAARQQSVAGEIEYNNALAELQNGEIEYNNALAELQNGEAAYASGLAELNRGEIEYQDGLATFEYEQVDATTELDQAEKDIVKAEKELTDLKEPNWYVLDLKSNPGFRSFMQESNQMASIALVIPLLFFLIAALVSMTSMTRLIDHDRTIIGTYKALGYTARAIALRYLSYAFIASLIGSAIGMSIGYNLFPPLIFNAFRSMFAIPPGPTIVSWFYTVFSFTIAFLSTVLPALLVSLRTMRETPASAMRPLAPRPGKRIILERIKPLWRHLSFLHKITARNLLRYKRRGLMTIIGVAGCTALMFTGFGLNDSLATVGPKQYGQIQRYDVALSVKADITSEERRVIVNSLENLTELSTYTEVRRETTEIVSPELTKDLSLMVVEDPTHFSDYFALQPRLEAPSLSPPESYTLGDGGVILTEQIARQFSLGVGDSVTLRTLHDKEATFVVANIVENYVYHFAFMTPESYEKGFGDTYESNQILGLFSEGIEHTPTSLTKLPGIASVAYTQKSVNDFARLTDTLAFVMAILIVSAAALIFVVLFSLNTINREERTRELASIKVLGFFNRELAAYIYREGIILTALGLVLGLLLGVGLERYIITTIEIDVFMFSRDLLFTSYLYSAGLTVLFAIIVNLLLYRQLTRVDMVTSLKAVE